MIIEKSLIKHFGSRLVTRSINLNFANLIKKDDLIILCETGLPNKVLDFDFTNQIELKSMNEIIIGKTHYMDDLVLVINSGKVVRSNSNDGCFLANSLVNFLKQLFIYDYLWEVIIKEEHFGKYRENKNHKKYAKYLENQFLEIDPKLIIDDENYFWGGLIEDIEFGIVG